MAGEESSGLPQLDFSKYPQIIVWFILIFILVFILVYIYILPHMQSIFHRRKSLQDSNIKRAEENLNLAKEQKDKNQAIIKEFELYKQNAEMQMKQKVKDSYDKKLLASKKTQDKQLEDIVNKISKQEAHYNEHFAEYKKELSSQILKKLDISIK